MEEETSNQRALFLNSKIRIPVVGLKVKGLLDNGEQIRKEKDIQ